MSEYYIVWNEDKTEGFVTDSLNDAKQVQSGKFRGAYTSAGSAFHETYDSEELILASVKIEEV